MDVATTEVPSINAQRELLSQAVANVLDNAVKHTRAEGASPCESTPMARRSC